MGVLAVDEEKLAHSLWSALPENKAQNILLLREKWVMYHWATQSNYENMYQRIHFDSFFILSNRKLESCATLIHVLTDINMYHNEIW